MSLYISNHFSTSENVVDEFAKEILLRIFFIWPLSRLFACPLLYKNIYSEMFKFIFQITFWYTNKFHYFSTRMEKLKFYFTLKTAHKSLSCFYVLSLPSLSHTLSHLHTRTHIKHSLFHSYAHTQTLTHTQTLSLSLSLFFFSLSLFPHTLSFTHMHTHTHTPTDTQKCTHSFPVSWKNLKSKKDETIALKKNDFRN